MPPQLLKRAGPLVQRPDGMGVRAIQHALAVSSSADEPDVAEHAQVLGYRGLWTVELFDEIADRPFLECEQRQNLTPPRLSHGIENVGGGCGACHSAIIFL